MEHKHLPNRYPYWCPYCHKVIGERATDVSFLIPARCEPYLEQTILNVLSNIRGNSEVLVYLDGWVPEKQIVIHDQRVRFYHGERAIGQRAAINYLAREATGKYVCKLDAHCAIDEGFDLKMMADCEPDWTVIPRMYNLDYQTFKPKLIHDFTHAVRMGKLHDYIYIGMNEKDELRTLYYPHAINKQMHHERKDILIDDVMSCMGCCFFMTRDRYWELDGCDEGHEGGWGQQAIELACKAWLSGGRLVVNKKTWFAHWFRAGDGGFPYPISGNQIDRVRAYSKDLWVNNKWNGQKLPLCWLISKFSPVPSWTSNDLRSLKLAGRKFIESSIKLSHVEGITDLTPPSTTSGLSGGEQMSPNAMSSSCLSGAITVTPENIDSMSGQPKVGGINAESIATNVINDGNVFPEVSTNRADQPSVHDSMNPNLGLSKSDSPISKIVSVPGPVPTPRLFINGNLIKDSDYCLGIEPINDESICSHCPLFKHNMAKRSSENKA